MAPIETGFAGTFFLAMGFTFRANAVRGPASQWFLIGGCALLLLVSAYFLPCSYPRGSKSELCWAFWRGIHSCYSTSAIPTDENREVHVILNQHELTAHRTYRPARPACSQELLARMVSP